MALRVWLPFNGNLKNNGLSEDGVNKREISYSNGKIGQCIDFSANNGVASGSEHMVVIPGQQLPTFTLCTWIKVTTQATTDKQIAAREGLGYNANGWHVGVNANTNKIVVGASNASYTYSDTGEIDQWYHVAIVHENKKNYWYFNGELKYSTSVGDMSYNITSTTDGNAIVFGARGSDGSYHWPFEGCLNDFRLYDEALSQKQIKEISKGLLAHYKLEGPGINANLLASGNIEKQLTSPDCIDYELGADVLGLSTGENIIISFEAKALVDDVHVIDLYFREIGGGEKSFTMSSAITLTDEYQRYTWFTTYPDISNITGTLKLRFRGNVYVPGGSGNANGYSVRYIKIERAPGDGIWIPHTSNTNYSALGYNLAVLKDTSGYENDLSSYNSVTFETDSERYDGSTVFNGTNNRLYRNNFIMPDLWTVSLWFKPARVTSTTQYLYAWGDGVSGSAGQQSALYINTTGICIHAKGNYVTLNYSFTPGIWYHAVLTCDGSIQKLYLNGEYLGEHSVGSKTGTFLTFGARSADAAGAGSGADYLYQGNLSDFRLYSTVLTLQEIQELYQTAGYITDNGSVLVYKFKEE